MATGDLETLAEAVTLLTTTVEGLRTETREQRVFAQRSRSLIRRLWIVIALMVALGVVVGFVAVDARHTARVASQAAQLAQQNANHAVLQCEAANQEGQRTRALWEKVITYPPIPGETARQKADREARVAQFRHDLDVTYPQQDCSKFAPPKP